MWDWILSHQLITGCVLMWLLSNAIGAMPTPKDGSSAFYEWAFKFTQAIGGALARVLAVYSPHTLTALTGQTTKETVPPNPPHAASELTPVTKP